MKPFLNSRIRLALIGAVTLMFISTQPAHAWWECGHHVVANLAYDQLAPEEQKAVIELLKHHPRYKEDFNPPDSIKNDPKAVDRWRIGAAAYWPDIARKFPTWSRSKWHYQLGAAQTIGDPVKMSVPESPGPLPKDATLATQDLHIEQAILLCRSVALDAKRPQPERAIALCWLLHLYGDGHQPCHAGSLYTFDVFPDGDLGGNRIKVKDGMSIHAIWDSQLGSQATPEEIASRTREIQADKKLLDFARTKANASHPSAWLHEDRELARRYVYTVELFAALAGAPKDKNGNAEIPGLSATYYKDAARISRQQVAVAGARLHPLLQRIAWANEAPRRKIRPAPREKFILP